MDGDGGKGPRRSEGHCLWSLKMRSVSSRGNTGTDNEMLFSLVGKVPFLDLRMWPTWRKINGTEKSPGHGHPNDKGELPRRVKFLKI